MRLSRFQAGLWDELGVVDHQAQSWRQQVTGLLSLGSTDRRQEPPVTLAATLRPYQPDGFRWLAFLWKYQLTSAAWTRRLSRRVTKIELDKYNDCRCTPSTSIF